MKIKIYAPVIIPTLCRYEKFVNCLESLEKCTGAKYTDVYIALDFPNSESARAGWIKIIDYLDNKTQNHNFNKLTIWKREVNYGVDHQNGNAIVAISDLCKIYDRYILTEDDNEFSPNFLEFLNKGLEKFKDDKRICEISAYNYPLIFPEMYKNNFYISKNGSPWGIGGWANREEEIRKYADLEVLKELLKNDKKLKKLKSDRPTAIGSIINMLKTRKLYYDTVKGCYATFEDKYWILPTISKVKNTGDDGSGAHSKSKNRQVIDYHNKLEIDNTSTFDFTDDIFTYRPIEVGYIEYPKSIYKFLYKKIVVRIDFFLLRHFNYLPKSKYI